MKTVVGLYDYLSEARDTIDDLVAAGVDRNNISLLMTDPDQRYSDAIEGDNGEQVAEATAEGAAVGGVVGGLAGLLLGLGMFTVPGLGFIVAAGPIVATLTGAGVGALAGGLIGALVGWGIPEEEAGYYAEGVRRGGKLVAVKADENRVDAISDIMNRHDPIDVRERAASWQANGWTGYETNAKPYTSQQIVTERERYNDFDNTDYNTYLSSNRQHYQTRYGTAGYDYDRYDPAYRYGYYLATSDRYNNYNRWEDVEPDARRRWEHDYATDRGTWEEFKDAVRHAWNETKEAVRT